MLCKTSQVWDFRIMPNRKFRNRFQLQRFYFEAKFIGSFYEQCNFACHWAATTRCLNILWKILMKRLWDLFMYVSITRNLYLYLLLIAFICSFLIVFVVLKSFIIFIVSQSRKSDIIQQRRTCRGNRTFYSPFVRMYRSNEMTKGSLASASGGGLPASQWRGDTSHRGITSRRSHLSVILQMICSFLYFVVYLAIKEAKTYLRRP